jgi:hypothetical protein
MEDYSIIHGQTLLEATFALLSALIISYVYVTWRACAHSTPSSALKPEISPPNMPGQLSADSRPNSSSPSPPRLWWKKHKSSIGDWVAPILAWTAVGWTTLALIGALLGEN